MTTTLMRCAAATANTRTNGTKMTMTNGSERVTRLERFSNADKSGEVAILRRGGKRALVFDAMRVKTLPMVAKKEAKADRGEKKLRGGEKSFAKQSSLRTTFVSRTPI